MEQELRDLIEKSAPYTPEERLAVVERFERMTPMGPRSDPADLIREDRER